MRLSLRNFGPIREVDLVVKPLTILIGPNSAGKSYVLRLLWSLLSLEPDFRGLVEIARRNLEAQKELSPAFHSFLEEITLNPTPMFSNLENYLKEVFEIQEIGELVRAGEDRCEIRILGEEGAEIRFEIKEGKLIFEVCGEEKIKEEIRKFVVVEVPSHIKKESADLILLKEEIQRAETIPAGAEKIEEVARFFVSNIPYVWEDLFEYVPASAAFLLPDGRAGIIHVREILVESVFTGWQPSKMNPIVKEYLKLLETLKPFERREVSHLWELLERGLEAQFELLRRPPYFEVRDRRRGLTYPLQAAPSGFREVGPLILLLKYADLKGHYLLVEEPEAHLHPDAQSLIVRALAGLTEYCPVLFTTHSIHVLDEIDNLLRLKLLPPEKKREEEYEEWEGLEPEEVAIYFFSKEGEVEVVSLSEEGIDKETGLDRIAREIANRHARVFEHFEIKRAREKA